MTFGIAAVEPEQFGGEQRRLGATGAGAYFEDDAFVVIRIARRQQHANLFFQRGEATLQLGHLGPGEFAHVGVIAIQVGFVFGDFVRDLAILTHRTRDFSHLRAFPGERGIFALIADYGRIAEAAFEFIEALFDPFDLIVKHWKCGSPLKKACIENSAPCDGK